jgi:hypothetical protein
MQLTVQRMKNRVVVWEHFHSIKSENYKVNHCKSETIRDHLCFAIRIVVILFI